MCEMVSSGCTTDEECGSDEFCNTNSHQCQLIVTQSCVAGAGNCYVANFTAGCEVESCCELVCLFDFLCCTQSWDEECANRALSLCPL